MEAVGVGYVFNLFDEGDLPGVDLRETGEYVRVDGSLYPLMKAATYEQSRMVDAALDIRGERRVDDFRWEEPRLPDGRGALAALLGGDDFYNPGAGIYLDSYLNDREPELIVRRCSLDGFERLVGRMRDDGEDYRDGAVAPFEAAEKASDGDESIPLDEAVEVRARRDPGYLGIHKRPEVACDEHLSSIDYRINRRPGKLPHVSDNAIDWERYIENRKSSVRCKVEHAFRIIKCQFGYKKTVYRGLLKNANRLYALFACANLYALAMAGRKLSTT